MRKFKIIGAALIALITFVISTIYDMTAGQSFGVCFIALAMWYFIWCDIDGDNSIGD